MLRTDWEALTDGERRKWALDYGPLRACAEVDCDEPGGTPWGPLWCARHDAERLQRVGDRLMDLTQPSDGRGDLTDEQWAAQFDWTVSTVADVMGYPPDDTADPVWCIFDAGEDDPPIMEFDMKEWAEIVCRILRRAGGLDVEG